MISSTPLEISKEKNVIYLNIKVKLSSRETAILCQEDDYLIIQIAAPPVDNKANNELIALLSKTYKTKKENISIIKGKTSTTKIIKIIK
ncbi:hypothetical cytosolic protein [Enterocytozoon bieneusi H348]|nr:hypothetical cytosolic protein [Enterocytozoon bieneusi H348]|eukprot:XP_002649957.1 hypothetical cytosolic protein [Enterocytozoon bieneusi H348]